MDTKLQCCRNLLVGGRDESSSSSILPKKMEVYNVVQVVGLDNQPNDGDTMEFGTQLLCVVTYWIMAMSTKMEPTMDSLSNCKVSNWLARGFSLTTVTPTKAFLDLL